MSVQVAVGRAESFWGDSLNEAAEAMRPGAYRHDAWERTVLDRASVALRRLEETERTALLRAIAQQRRIEVAEIRAKRAERDALEEQRATERAHNGQD